MKTPVFHFSVGSFFTPPLAHQPLRQYSTHPAIDYEQWERERAPPCGQADGFERRHPAHRAADTTGRIALR